MCTILSFYSFFQWPDFEEHRGPLTEFCLEHGITGSILIAREGINGTVSGKRLALDGLLEKLHDSIPNAEFDPKFSTASETPFRRMKVRPKKEIVSFGVEGLDPSKTGTFVDAADWNDLLSDEEVVLIDARNEYEIAIGTFPGAINPQTESFRELPERLASHPELRPGTNAEKPKVAMFCTGGVRCEKASALLLQQGFDQVFQLRGGILKYLEKVPASDSRWQGECYVFDGRVSVGSGLEPGDLEVCPNCNAALGLAERSADGYERGVTCSGCVDSITPRRRSRFAERQRQIDLAERRGEKHLGGRANR